MRESTHNILTYELYYLNILRIRKYTFIIKFVINIGIN